MINTTGVIVSMVNNQYGHIKFGAGETAIFCAKSLFRLLFSYYTVPSRDGHFLCQVPLQVIWSLFSWLTIWAVSVIILPSNLGRGLYICSTVINLGLFIGTAGSTRGTLCASLPCSLTLTRYTGTSPPFILGVSSILFPLPHPTFLEIKILSPLLK